MTADAHANSFKWDSSGTSTAAPQDGSGTWNTSSPLWSSGISDLPWSAADGALNTAIIGTGGTAGIITLGAGVTVGGVLFDTVGYGAYLIGDSNSSLSLGGTTTTSIQLLANATVDANLVGTGLTITGSGSTLVPTGTLKLGNANNYTGDTQLSGGNLNLDFSRSPAIQTNLIRNTGQAIFNAGSLTITGTGNGRIQQVAGTTFTAGASTIAIQNSAVLNLAQLTHNAGATANFILPAGNQSSTNGILTSSTNTSGSILGGWAIVNSNTWATVTNGNISGLSSYSSTVVDGTTDLDVAPGNGSWAGKTVNSVRFNSAGTYDPTLTGTITINSGGILETANVGNSPVTFITPFSSPHITTGSSNELVVSQFNTASAMTLSSVTDNGNSVGLTKNGPGLLVLGSASNYSGPTVINGGTLQITQDNAASNLGATPTSPIPNQIVLNGGALSVNNNLTININRGIGLGPGGGTFTGSSLTGTFRSIIYNGIIADEFPGVPGSLTKLTTSPDFLGGANTFTGTLYLAAGTLQVSNTGSFASSLGFNGGTLGVDPARTTDLSFNGTTVYSNVSTISAGVPLVTNLNLNAINRKEGAILDFGSTLPSSGSIRTTNQNANFPGGQSTIVGGWAFAAGSWAVSGPSGVISGLPTTSESSVNTAAAQPLVPAADINLNGTGTSTTSTLTINSLTCTSGTSTLSINPASTLTVATGGVLVTTPTAISISGAGNLTSGNGQDLIITDSSNSNSSITISANITDNGTVPVGLTWSVLGGGVPSLTLAGNNTFTGDTTLNSSRTIIASSQALANSTLNYNNQGGSVSILTGLNSANFGGIKGSQNLVLPITTNFAFSVGANSQSTTYSGTFTGLTGAGATFTKTGSGALTLTAPQTFSAATVINSGTLQLNASLSATAAVNISNGTLAGNASLNPLATVTVNSTGKLLPGTFISPRDGGNTIGTLNIGPLILNDGSIVDFLLGSSGQSSLLAVTGSITFPSTGQITLNVNDNNGNNNQGSLAPGTYKLFTYTNGLVNVATTNLSSHFVLPAIAGESAAISSTTTTGAGEIDLMLTSTGTTPANLIWNGNTVDWDVNTHPNWNSNSKFQQADNFTFDDSNNGQHTVTISVPVQPSSVSIAGSASYLFNGAFGIADPSSVACSFTQTGSGSVTLSTNNSFTGPITIGTGADTPQFTLASTGKLASSSITINTAATATIDGLITSTPNTTVKGHLILSAADNANAPTTTPLIRTLGTLNISSTGSITLSSASVHTGRSVMVLSNLTNAGKIDLSNNDLLIKNGDIGTIASELKTGFNAHTGYWNGTTGIISIAAAADSRNLTTLGYRVGGITFDGIETTSADALVKYTYYGDADLNGTVNGADYQQIDTGFGNHASDWSHGDFNYDGQVNGSDFALIDNTFNQISATNATPLAIETTSTDFPADSLNPHPSPFVTATVPEPAGWSLLYAMALVGVQRRSRKVTPIAQTVFKS